MNETLEFLVHHGYTVLFAWVFVEQIGLPIPTVPMLLAAGALAGTGRLSLVTATVVAIAAAMLSDSLWYQLGRRRGARVLQMLCRISLEPDSCVRRAENLYGKHGAGSLLLAKFIPGLNTASPPLAGIFRMRLERFLFFDALGILLWAGAYLGLGYAFSDQLERVADRALTLGTWLIALLLAGFGGFLVWKYVKRQRFLRELRVARITPEELKKMLDAGEDVVIADLRHALDFQVEPEMIPGAVHINAEDLEQMNQHVPPNREVVLYCS
ncbi:MAG TPA: VTT domain-containing protein [Candidatus Acidoferrales bacterium]|nr:VTT domain-containing protein [Candidatus Acidoferrales bacterium]